MNQPAKDPRLMLKRTLILLALIALPAFCDDISGPLRRTLTEESWGTIYYVPQELKDYDYTRNVENGTRTIESKLGKVTITDTGIGSFKIDYPDTTLTLDSDQDSVTIKFRNQTYKIVKTGPKSMTITLPDDEIKYAATETEFVISGQKGTTKIVERDGNYHMESPVGVFSYVPDPNGGFKVRGAPAVQHTYMIRGAIFQDAGVGVLIDLRRFAPEAPIFRFMEWIPLREFR